MTERQGSGARYGRVRPAEAHMLTRRAPLVTRSARTGTSPSAREALQDEVDGAVEGGPGDVGPAEPQVVGAVEELERHRGADAVQGRAEALRLPGRDEAVGRAVQQQE